MKISRMALIGTVLALGGAGLAGCDFQGGVAVTAQQLANLVSNSPKACNDISLLGGDLATIAGQIGAANPNNAQVQSIVNKIDSGVGATNADCQTLAKSFTAQAPKSLLTAKVKLDPKIWAKLGH